MPESFEELLNSHRREKAEFDAHYDRIKTEEARKQAETAEIGRMLREEQLRVGHALASSASALLDADHGISVDDYNKDRLFYWGAPLEETRRRYNEILAGQGIVMWYSGAWQRVNDEGITISIPAYVDTSGNLRTNVYSSGGGYPASGPGRKVIPIDAQVNRPELYDRASASSIRSHLASLVLRYDLDV